MSGLRTVLCHLGAIARQEAEAVDGASSGISSTIQATAKPARLARVLSHTEGPVWAVQWRPGEPAEGTFGDVAVAFGSGRIDVYRVPLLPRAVAAESEIVTESACTLRLARAEPVISHTTLEQVAVPAMLRWDRTGERLLVGYQDGAMAVWTAPRSEDAALELVYLNPASKQPMRCVEWLDEESLGEDGVDDLVLGVDYSGDAVVLDLRDAECAPPLARTAVSSVNAVCSALLADGTVAVGSDDGCARFIFLPKLLGNEGSKTRKLKVGGEGEAVWGACAIRPAGADAAACAFCTHGGTVVVSDVESMIAHRRRPDEKFEIEARRAWSADVHGGGGALVLGGKRAACGINALLGDEMVAMYCAATAPAVGGGAWLITGGMGHFAVALLST